MSKPRAAIILAAGKSTRMKSKTSKVLHSVGGKPMLAWVADLARSVGVERTVCVVGEANADVRDAAIELGLEIAIQEPQLGTGHAVLAAKDALADFDGLVTVFYADNPLIKPDTAERVYAALDQGADLAVLGFETPEPAMWGRLVMDGEHLTEIVEAKEATPEQLKITLCNSGVISASRADMFAALARVDNKNTKGEYYLTDVVGILRGDGRKAVAVVADETEVLGVNSRSDLAKAERAFQAGMRNEMLEKGVTLQDPETVYFSHDTEIASDVTIGSHVVFGPGVSIAEDAVIHPYCHISEARVGAGAEIGPFARLRPGTDLGAQTKIGNFVEVKKAQIGEGSKVSHLSYIGDAEVGSGVNVGAGTITCNYDGYFKHKTTIGDGAFIGTHSSLVAPVTIGKGAFLGSGGVITNDVPDDALALARAAQTNKPGWAKRFRAAMSKRKQQKE